MTLPPDYLQYPRRHHGMDHDWYAWRHHFRVPDFRWPGGAGIALWVSPVLEFFPLNPAGMPFRAPGSMVTPYPDLRHYTTRDYGNRVGIYRILALLDEYGIRASVPVNAAVARRYPALVEDIVARGHEIVAHGLDMDHLHHAGMDPAVEAELIDSCLATLRGISGQPVTGWLSPAQCQSPATVDLLQERGIEYFCDFINDELPYSFSTRSGTLTAMPYTLELADRQLLVENHHTEAEYVEQIRDQFAWLQSEAARGPGRILCLPLTPYIMGLPFRIRALREVLALLSAGSTVWSASAADIRAAWLAVSGSDWTGD